MNAEVLNTVHSGMEYATSILAATIASYAFVRYKAVKSTFNLLWFWAFATIAVCDYVHATVSLAHFDAVDECWLPWTWSVSRMMLAIVLVIAVVNAWHRVPVYAKYWIPMLIFSIMTLMYIPTIGMNTEFIHSDSCIARPFDAALSVTWGILFLIFLFIPSASIHMPSSFKLFLLLGVTAHTVMAVGSRQALDPAFMLAHVIKVAEYGFLALHCVIEDYRAKHLNGNCGYARLMESKGASAEDIERLEDIQGVARDIRTRWESR